MPQVDDTGWNKGQGRRWCWKGSRSRIFWRDGGRDLASSVDFGRGWEVQDIAHSLSVHTLGKVPFAWQALDLTSPQCSAYTEWTGWGDWHNTLLDCPGGWCKGVWVGGEKKVDAEPDLVLPLVRPVGWMDGWVPGQAFTIGRYLAYHSPYLP